MPTSSSTTTSPWPSALFSFRQRRAKQGYTQTLQHLLPPSFTISSHMDCPIPDTVHAFQDEAFPAVSGGDEAVS